MKHYSIHQFADPNLSHYGYLIISGREAAAVDPPRDVGPFLALLGKEGATLKAIIETHPHADFASGHLELHEETGAPIRISRLVAAQYEHVPFDDGESIALGSVTLEALNTPGHSPDSISVLLRDADGRQRALFSGDTLFVGDVGRPDLRERAGSIQAKREELAGMMYDTVQNVLKQLPDDIVVYPAHGAGTLCGKSLRDAPSTTIGEERASNPAFRSMSRAEFVTMLTGGQPMIPAYFGFDVALNRKGAEPLEKSLARIPTLPEAPEDVLIVDTRDAADYDAGHARGALHIPESGLRFETWLGSIVRPDERFVVVVSDEEARDRVLRRAAKIGYECNVAGVLAGAGGESRPAYLDLNDFLAQTDAFTVIDVRQAHERDERLVFARSMNIPLDELRERVAEIPTHKPIVVHCAGGYRSMIAESIIAPRAPVPVYDIGERVRLMP